MKRFEQYTRHLDILKQGNKEDLTNTFIISGIVDKYFLQFELGWKVLKELLQYEGKSAAASGSPREIIKGAYAYFDFLEEETWLQMLKDRNNLTHIYNETAARELVERILTEYMKAFDQLQKGIVNRYGDELEGMD